MTRRTFCSGFICSAGVLGVEGANAWVPVSRPNLRVGILSDVHVTKPENANWFEKALRHFDSVKVDAVMITGDLTTWNEFSEFETVAHTWFKVFPDDCRSDGARIERLFITGNHDVDGWAYGGARFKSVEEAKPTSFFFHREEFWEKLFHERYEPIVVKDVKGYTFILRNWMSILGTESSGHPLAAGFRDEVSPLPDVMDKLGDRLRGKTFFYAQHEPMAGTVNTAESVDGVRQSGKHSDSETRRLLEKYPNCVAFTGHTHYSLTDETSIWQGGFTALNCSCARGYAFSRPGYENGFAVEDFNRRPPYEMERFDHTSVRQGMVMDVFDDHIRFERLDLTFGLPLGSDWVVPLFAGGVTIPSSGRPKYDFIRRVRESRAPQFKPDSKVSVSFVENGLRRKADGMGALDSASAHRQIVVSFPPVVVGLSSPTRAYAFRVQCEARETGVGFSAVQVRNVLSPNFAQSQVRDVEPCTCRFPCVELPSGRPLRFTVTPRNCWGVEGTPIASRWMTVQDSRLFTL